MKAAACGTWMGDLITALIVTDMMLQDNLYPKWAPRTRYDNCADATIFNDRRLNFTFDDWICVAEVNYNSILNLSEP